MWESRANQALIYTQACLYVFGGSFDSGYLRSCEKFDERCGKWVKLPSLSQPRRIYAIAQYKQNIYLPRWHASEKLEVFCTVTDTFVEEKCVRLGSHCLLGIACEEGLVVIRGNGSAVLWKAATGCVREVRCGKTWGSELLCRRGNSVFWSTWEEGKLYVCELTGLVVSHIQASASPFSP